MNFLQTIENAFGQMPCVKQRHCKSIPLLDAHDSIWSHFALPLLAIAFLSAFLMPSFSWAGDDHRAFPPVLFVPEICNNGIDDDGDGLIDLADSDCAPCSTTVFFTETFGTGGRTTTSYTNFCYEDGSGNDCLQFAPSTEINDGEYAIAQAPNPIGGHPTWTYSGDHTGDAGGRMMVVNADLTPGEFYRRTITGVYPNADVTVELWLRNTIMPGYDLLKPNVTFKLLNSSNAVLGSISTGDIPEDNTWKKYSLSLNPGNLTSVKIVLVNNGPGGEGNDLTLDDIVAKQVLTPPAPTLSATCANPTATISVTAPTGANLQYSINGTTYQSSTSFAGVSAGTYNVTVKNATTGCFSPATAITVYNAPTISVQPGGGTICSGSAYNLSVLAANAATYQWQSSTNNVTFTNISEATSSNYNTGILTSTTYYQVLLNNGTCSLTSGKATVTVQVCPEICDNGLDDDNDGLTDCADPDCTTTGGYATAVTSQTGITNPNNALGAPNSTFAKLYETGDRLVLDFGVAIPAGGKYIITWRRKSTYTNTVAANMVVEESANNSTFTQNAVKPSTSSKTTFVTTTMTTGVPTRYIRLKTNGGTDDDFVIDAVTRITCLLEICNNGLDDDGDGLADCADSDCGGAP
ncbi:MAG: hypothetical protein IPM82_22245 [Saprospiraceae bacterium]|nr:hypothetical protein [Saprospiraceae bacterium]